MRNLSRSVLLVSSLILILLLCGCPKKDENNPTPAAPNLKVLVYDVASMPIEGATVVVGSKTATTTAAGEAQILIDPGIYSATITRSGYAPNARSITVPTGSPAIAMVNMLAATGGGATIPTTGGTAASDDSSAIVTVPSGGVSGSTELTVTSLPQGMFNALPAGLPSGDSMLSLPVAAAYVEAAGGTINASLTRIRMRNDQPTVYTVTSTGISYFVYTTAAGWQDVGPAQVSSDGMWFEMPAAFQRVVRSLDGHDYWGAYIARRPQTWIWGTILVRTGPSSVEGIPGALVSIPSSGLSGTTDASGGFYINVPAGGGTPGNPVVFGSLGVQVFKDGYTPYPLEASGQRVAEIGMAEHYATGDLFLRPLTDLSGSGTIYIEVKSASTNAPIYNAQVTVMELTRHLFSDSSGAVTFDNVPAGTYRVQATASGFQSTITNNIEVVDSQTTTRYMLLSTSLGEGQRRIVLSWNAHPRDLDTHVLVPDTLTPTSFGYEVNFQSHGAGDVTTEYPYANLDMDVTSGYGPETVTFGRLVTGTYHYIVYDYSSDTNYPMSDSSGAQVQVFDSHGLVYTFHIPTGGGIAHYWHVLDIEGPSGRFIPVNQILASPPWPLGGTHGKMKMAKK